MEKFKFTHEWRSSGSDSPEYLHTMAELALHIDNVNLMQNEDIWSRTIRESVLASAYSLALWLASSWWRLNWEPLPRRGVRPTLDWRMAHELGAANHGFVWPQILFASDTEVMQVWAVTTSADDSQSVRYLNGLNVPAFVPIEDFQHSVEDFIISVLNRLDAMDCQNTDLLNLWQIIQEDRTNIDHAKYRRLEAEMGYDPDECPEKLIKKAFVLEQKMGTSSFSELAPVYGKSAINTPLAVIEELSDSPGLVGVPTVQCPKEAQPLPGAPWERAVAAARAVRQMMGNTRDALDNNQLYDLLGLNASDVEQWSPAKRYEAAIAVPGVNKQFRFVPRKAHPIAKRFELARFLGDYLATGQANGKWLTSTDLATSRQKYQRAFAAEFLCPIGALQDFLQDDYSESAIEDAVQYFQVSQQTVESLLVNNHLIPPSIVGDYAESRLPYNLGI